MKYLGENFVKKIVDWIKGREVWTSGTGENSVITVACKESLQSGMGKGAIGRWSYAEGIYNTARGEDSHAEGNSVQAYGRASHAEGCITYASGTNSHAEGLGTVAGCTCSHAEGCYNVVDWDAIHVVGIGNYENDSRMNAEVIYYNYGNTKNGYKYLIGVGGYDGTTTVNVDKHKSVQEVIAELTAGMRALWMPVTEASGETVAMEANRVYEITVGDTLTLTLTAAEDTTIVNEWQGSFDTGSTAPTVTWPADVIWADTPVVAANTHYEFSIRLSGGKYYGLVQSWAISTEEESV